MNLNVVWGHRNKNDYQLERNTCMLGEDVLNAQYIPLYFPVLYLEWNTGVAKIRVLEGEDPVVRIQQLQHPATRVTQLKYTVCPRSLVI